MNKYISQALILVIMAGFLSSCNTTKFLNSDEQLLHKNEIIILEPDINERNNGFIHRTLRGFIRNTEDRRGFEWVYENIDRRVNSEFWLQLRNPRENAENKFVRDKQKEGVLYFLDPQTKVDLRYDLENHVLLKPNNNRFQVWLYQKIDADHPSKFWRSVKNKIGQPPVLVDSTQIERTRKSMENHLYSKGYFDSKVNYFIKDRDKKSIVRFYTYGLNPYYIKSYKIISEDSIILQELDANFSNSHIRAGEILTLDNYDKERIRISNELREKGYYNFTPNYISELQSDKKTDSLDISVIIYPPNDSSYFHKYTNDKIKVYLDVNPEDIDSNTSSVVYDDYNFLFKGKEPPIRLKTLSQRIKIKEETHFNQQDLDKTKEQLNVLGLYKFVYVSPSISSLDKKKLNYSIHLNSLKKITLGYDIDLNTASNSSTNQGPLLGSTFRGNYRNRNLFRGAEIWDSFIEVGLEYTLRDQGEGFNPISTFNFRFQNDITLPGLKDWNLTFGLYKKILSAERRSILNRNIESAKSQISLGYDYKSINTFYRYHLLSAALNYEYAYPEKQRITRIKPVGIYYFDPETEPNFETIIAENAVYRESFTTQLFTALLLNELDFNFQSKPNSFGESYSFRLFLETSGLEVMGIEALYNAINNSNDTFQFNNKIDFARFAKTTLTWSYLRQFNSDRSIGLKLKTGIIGALDGSTPYVKALFSGGAYSIRAWAERDLGPGSYIAPKESGVQIPFQVGDFLLELVSEFRFPLFAYLKGAVFLDAGNIWSLNPNDDREGAYISSDWYRQIGVGSGFGFRLDINYAVIRLDIGQKIYLPHINEATGNQWAIKTFRDIRLGGFNYNLALGYPF